ncbi:MAG: preprotein translocase subunit SecE [Actinobacteria bacterium]|jgi:preprotein translocase subunit SecE|nr:preprotein translocase subunit SecE [Actinomycetota bacterium]
MAKVNDAAVGHGPASSDEKKGLFVRVSLFYRQIGDELRKVVWPTREQLTNYTWVVVGFVALLAAIVGIIDLGVAKAVLSVFGA